MFVGAIFLMLGGACVAYLWAGGSIFEREPPLLAFGILLIVLGAGLAGSPRAGAPLVTGRLRARPLAPRPVPPRSPRVPRGRATHDPVPRGSLLWIVLCV